MLEIFALIFLTRKMGALAIRKGLNARPWKIYTVLAWFGGEIAGFVAGVFLFGQDNLFGLILFALCCAVGGYFLIHYVLQKKPDDLNDDINRIGV